MPIRIVTEPKTCAQCGMTFNRPSRQPISWWKNARFCSAACQQVARKPLPRRCAKCDQTFTPTQSRKARGGVRYCSVACANRDQEVCQVKTRYRQRRTATEKRSEHIMIAEARIGRRLLPNEVVHHRDENKLNNDPSNLQVMDRAEHGRLHARLRRERKAALAA